MSISRTWRSRCRGRWSRSYVWTWRCGRSGSTGSSSRATSRRSPKEKIRLIWFTGCVHQLMLDILFLPSPWNYCWNWQLWRFYFAGEHDRWSLFCCGWTFQGTVVFIDQSDRWLFFFADWQMVMIIIADAPERWWWLLLLVSLKNY